MRVFIDTNVWAYRLDGREPKKQARMQRWLPEVVGRDDVVISTQVLIELRSVATRKLRPALSAAQIRALLEAMAGFDVVTTDTAMILDANELAAREQLSWFDALIAEAAIRSHCSVLFSEDFGHERMLDGVKVLNPWRL
ncbi:PIN domain protein [Synechococcus sp. RS9909]|uniref:PIN domain-containing protein n=1 Tax=unclassified Synechococcus TaxID=2626047 RepID=UPI000069073F|nr:MULTISPECIES: PIN domain-containing protein [unclassified Synechococcus]EAQ70248.1 PIN domain protein [Synechococcus sp. RS9917]QNI78097.1 PIN domain protein [Synechococcus sp. RS9909]